MTKILWKVDFCQKNAGRPLGGGAREFLWPKVLYALIEGCFLSIIAGSVLDNGNSFTGGRHASLMAAAAAAGGSRGVGNVPEATQLREGLLTGTLTGQKVNYLDSGYSEEDADQQQVTSCLMKTSSGSIYIPPSESKSNKSTAAAVNNGYNTIFRHAKEPHDGLPTGIPLRPLFVVAES